MTANSLLGTWRLKSYVVTTAGERRTLRREPNGLPQSADGQMRVIAAATDRIVPVGKALRHSEEVALYETLFTYAGNSNFCRTR